MNSRLLAVRVKSNANYVCQECGSTELIQAHHQIKGDDDSLIVLCANCHSKKHPKVPKPLFFVAKVRQPYWWNISASTIAKQIDVCSRTVIRKARRLGIPTGCSISNEDIERIKGYKKYSSVNKLSKITKFKKKIYLLRYYILERACPKCKSKIITKSGWDRGVQRYRCQRCGVTYTPIIKKEIDIVMN